MFFPKIVPFAEKHAALLAGMLTGVTGIIALSWWFSLDPTRDFAERLPGADNRPASLSSSSENVEIGEFFERFGTTVQPLPGSWPRFRGAGIDNIAKEKTPLISGFEGRPPEILWSVDLGEGHAAPAVNKGRVFLLDYDEEKKADALRCFSLADGRELWRRWYGVHVKRNHGMSRTVPAVSNGYVVTMGPRCHVMCVREENGDFMWGMDLEKDWGSEVPFWYTGQCPLIEDSVAVIAPAGKALLIGAHLRTGEVMWETPNASGFKMSHSSVMPMTVAGRRMYVYSAIGGITGVSAEPEDRGTVLWETRDWNQTVIAPSPVLLPGDRILMTAGYGAGSMLFRIKEEEGRFSAETLLQFGPEEGFACEQQTPILYRGHLFGILPKDAGANRNQFVCCDPADLQNFVWTSGRIQRFGLGPFLLADGKFFILSDDGVLTIAEASTAEFRLLGQAKVLNGHDAWGPIALAGGRMLLRDSKQMICLNVRSM